MNLGRVGGILEAKKIAGLAETHYAQIAQKSPVDIILYNVPSRTGSNIDPKTVIKLANNYSNIIGIKEATADLTRVRQIREGTVSDFLLLSGDDETTKDFILSGGDGVISVTANVAPEKMSKMCVSALEGNVEEAGKIDKTLVGLHKALFLESNPIPVKWVLNKLGLIEPGIRLPMTWLSEDFEDDLFNAMKQADIV